jgi:hypothetical protein
MVCRANTYDSRKKTLADDFVPSSISIERSFFVSGCSAKPDFMLVSTFTWFPDESYA